MSVPDVIWESYGGVRLRMKGGTLSSLLVGVGRLLPSFLIRCCMPPTPEENRFDPPLTLRGVASCTSMQRMRNIP